MDVEKLINMINDRLQLEDQITLDEFTQILNEYETEGGNKDTLLLSLFYVIMLIDKRSSTNIAYWRGQAFAYKEIIEELFSNNDMTM